MTDSVIQNCEVLLQRAKENLSINEKKLSDVKEKMFDRHGSIRPNMSSEAAQRQAEIDALKDRIKKLEVALSDAKADLPRREAERKKAQELNAKADVRDKDAADLVEQLRKIERESSDLREEANKCLALTSATLKVLQSREAETQAVIDREQMEAKGRHESMLNSAKYALEQAIQRRANDAVLDRLRKEVELLEKDLVTYA